MRESGDKAGKVQEATMKTKREPVFSTLRSVHILGTLVILAIILSSWSPSLAQRRGPVVDVLGRPENAPPDAYAYVSVIDPNTGRAIDDLSDANFSVQISGQDVDASASPEISGVAVVMVIDRGGIARRGDPRINEAVELADSLLAELNLDGTETADMAALIGIRGQEAGGLAPLSEFTDFDPNILRNEFDKLRTEIVDEVTPLYDGIDQAIEWIAENDDVQTLKKLTRRRPIIIVFSDGIDNQFSSESHETIIINKCLQNDILLYAVRMEAPGRTTDADNLEALTSQTNGIYMTHNADTHDQVLDLFKDIVTLRQSYRVSFPLYRPQGDYQVSIQVLDTATGDGSDEVTVSSPLRPPEITLTMPTDGEKQTVPYAEASRRFEPVSISLKVQVTPVDEVARDPSEVRYFANGVRIGTGSTPPDFEFTWNVNAVVSPTAETQVRDLTLMAEADDAYLGTKMTSQAINIQVTWERLPPTPTPPPLEVIKEKARTNWWMILALAGLLIGLLLLFILLIRTRGEVARKVAVRTTGVLKGVTKRLGATPQRALGKLVVLQGANMGKEFRLAAQVTKVGRDPQFCDFALYDEFVSNPHFSIQAEQTQLYITDEGSTNGSQVNGMPIPPHQRVLLQPDAIVEAGNTRLQFKRLGGTTRQLGSAGSGPSASVTQPTPGQSPPPPPATQPSRRPEVIQGPRGSDPRRRGGPTQPN
jgi:Mg-chelatase subunit ChlD